MARVRPVTDAAGPALDGPEIICVVGPTGVGKSALAMDLATALDGEIIGADSRQIYRGLDIGTAKPSTADRQAVPHHLIDVVGPEEPFSAGRYGACAGRAVEEIRARGRVPIVVGGTGLYIRALVDGIWDSPTPAPGLREALDALGTAECPHEPHRWLQRLDPEAAATLHPNDAYKVRRALEIVLTCGRSASDIRREHGFPGRFRALMVGVTCAREALYQRINARADAMLAAGWVAEVQGLLDQGVSRHAPAMNAVGYRELADHLCDGVGLETAATAIKQATRRYAKRQFTWFRRDARIAWLQVAGPNRRECVSTVANAYKRGVMRVDVSVRQAP